jgi:hypothetical protein
MGDEIKKAKELINQKMTERVERCRTKVEQVLAEENCFIDVAMVISQQGIIPQLSIRPKPEN